MLDDESRAHLGVALRVTLATRPMARADLVGGERERCRGLACEPRRHDWLLGRRALKALLPAGTDTSRVVLPHPNLSLTHAGGVAFAACAIGGDVRGTGIDFEPCGRAPYPGVARFFLLPGEMAAVRGDHALLRLWTVKEALYKATPDNADNVLVDYELDDVMVPRGAARGPRGERMRYASVTVAGGVMTVAVALGKVGRRVAV